LSILGITDKRKYYIALAVRMDGYEGLQSRYGIERFFEIKRTLLDACQFSFPEAYCLFGGDDMVTVLMVREAFINTSDLYETLDALHNLVISEYGISLTIGIGTHALRPESVPESTRNARIATGYRLIFGLSQNIEYDFVRMRIGVSPVYPEQVERDLLDAVRKGNPSRFETNLTLFFDSICVGGLSFVQMAVPNLCMQIYRTFPDEVQNSCDLTRLYAELENCEFYLQQQRIIRAFGLAYMKEQITEQKTNERHKELVSIIVAYIEENYPNQDLSVVSIAEHVQVSQNTIRLLFKEHLDAMPRDYIIRIRMKKACKLLEETEQTAKDIAALVGFTESRYFYNVFKKQLGMTAYEYRIGKREKYK